jgi:hypothetical protein
MDSDSSELAEAYHALFTKDGKPRKALEDNTEGMASTMSFVKTIIVAPEFRGHDLGLYFFWDFIRHVAKLDSCGLLVCKPAPINHDKDQKEESFSKMTWREAQKKLQRYWQRLGLIEIGKSGIFVLDLAYRLKAWNEISSAKVPRAEA